MDDEVITSQAQTLSFFRSDERIHAFAERLGTQRNKQTIGLTSKIETIERLFLAKPRQSKQYIYIYLHTNQEDVVRDGTCRGVWHTKGQERIELSPY
jgi:phosphopantothenate synthetase